MFLASAVAALEMKKCVNGNYVELYIQTDFFKFSTLPKQSVASGTCVVFENAVGENNVVLQRNQLRLISVLEMKEINNKTCLVYESCKVQFLTLALTAFRKIRHALLGRKGGRGKKKCEFVRDQKKKF